MFGLFDHTVYSFLDLSGVLSHPHVGSFVFTGQGVGQVVITMDGDKTIHEIGVDGTVVLAKVPGHAGKITIECQQTSNVHKWLLYAYQRINMDNVEEWGRMTALLRNITDKTSHTLKGLSFDRIPEKRYGPEGQMIEWVLFAADIDSTAPNETGAGGLSALAKQFL